MLYPSDILKSWFGERACNILIIWFSLSPYILPKRSTVTFWGIETNLGSPNHTFTVIVHSDIKIHPPVSLLWIVDEVVMSVHKRSIKWFAPVYFQKKSPLFSRLKFGLHNMSIKMCSWIESAERQRYVGQGEYDTTAFHDDINTRMEYKFWGPFSDTAQSWMMKDWSNLLTGFEVCTASVSLFTCHNQRWSN